MKTKFMIWSAAAFLWMAINADDGALFYFFAIHLLVCSVGLSFRRRELKKQSGKDALPPKGAASSPEQLPGRRVSGAVRVKRT